MPLATAAVCSSQLRLTRTTCSSSSSRSAQPRCHSICRGTAAAGSSIHSRLHRPSSSCLYGAASPSAPTPRRSMRRRAATPQGPSDSGRAGAQASSAAAAGGPFGEEVAQIQDTEDQRLNVMDQVVEEANAQDKEAPQLPDSDFTTPKKTAPPVARTAGAALGTAALTTLGAAAGPAGAAVGATVGATVGGAIMDALVGSEEKKEQYDKGVEEIGLRVKEATEQLVGNVEGAASAAADRAEHAGRGEGHQSTSSPAAGGTPTSANSYESEVSQPGNKQAGLQQDIPTPASGTASNGGDVSPSAKADQPTSAAGYDQELDTNQLSPAAGQQGPKGSIPSAIGDDSGAMTGGGFASGAGVTRGDESGVTDAPENVNVLSSADAGYYAYRSRPDIRAEAVSVEDAVAEAGWGDEGKDWEWGEAEKAAQKERELVPAAEQGGAGVGRETGGEEESAEQLLGKARGVPAAAEATTAAVTDRAAEAAAAAGGSEQGSGGRAVGAPATGAAHQGEAAAAVTRAGDNKGDTMDLGDLAAKVTGGSDVAKGDSSKGGQAGGGEVAVDQSSGNMVQTGESVAEKVAEEFGVGPEASDGVAEAEAYQREAQGDDKA